MRILISLKAANGSFVAPDLSHGRLVANAPKDVPFMLEDLGGNRLRLRALTAQGRFVEAVGGGGQELQARSLTPNENCTFTLVRINDKEVALLAPNGTHYVTCESNGDITARATQRGAQETFVKTRFVPQSKTKKKEKELAQDIEPMWNDVTHAKIVETALRLMYKNHLTRTAVRHLYTFTSYSEFTNAIYKGLHDADYLWEYTGVAYEYHFYHPGTGRNYMGTTDTARSMGVKYFEVALSLGQDLYRKFSRGEHPNSAELAACGYQLGLCLHYMTDLTQPMHASNFTNVFGEHFPVMDPLEWRHKGLEDMTEKIVKDQNYLDQAPDLTYDMFNPEPYGSASDILHEAAFIANRTFEQTVRPLMPTVIGSWSEAVVKTIIDASIKTVGLHSVARLLAFFGMTASRAELVKPGTLYRLRGYQGKYVTKVDDWLKLEDRRVGPTQEFFFIGNDDGTYRIVCNAARGRRWTMSDQAWNLCIPRLDLPGGDLNRAKFKLISVGTRIKIQEFTKNELISVKTHVSWIGHLVRWPDDGGDTFKFQLEEVGPMLLQEEPEAPAQAQVLAESPTTVTNGSTKSVHFHFNIQL